MPPEVILYCPQATLNEFTTGLKRGLAKLQENYTGQAYGADMAEDHLVA